VGSCGLGCCLPDRLAPGRKSSEEPRLWVSTWIVLVMSKILLGQLYVYSLLIGHDTKTKCWRDLLGEAVGAP